METRQKRSREEGSCDEDLDKRVTKKARLKKIGISDLAEELVMLILVKVPKKNIGNSEI